MSFHVNQKIVCIDDAWRHPGWKLLPHIVRPVAGQVYTVRTFGMERFDPADALGVRLEEILNLEQRWAQGVFELAFAARRFRPVIERKTSISIFTSLLTPNSPARLTELA